MTSTFDDTQEILLRHRRRPRRRVERRRTLVMAMDVARAQAAIKRLRLDGALNLLSDILLRPRPHVTLGHLPAALPA
jgi:hypothetical protein